MSEKTNTVIKHRQLISSEPRGRLVCIHSRSIDGLQVAVPGLNIALCLPFFQILSLRRWSGSEYLFNRERPVEFAADAESRCGFRPESRGPACSLLLNSGFALRLAWPRYAGSARLGLRSSGGDVGAAYSNMINAAEHPWSARPGRLAYPRVGSQPRVCGAGGVQVKT
jgi:hypothetical protein